MTPRQLPPLQLGYSALAIDGTHAGTRPADAWRTSPARSATGMQRWVDLDGEGLPGILTEDDARLVLPAQRQRVEPGGPGDRALRAGRAWSRPSRPRPRRTRP